MVLLLPPHPLPRPSKIERVGRRKSRSQQAAESIHLLIPPLLVTSGIEIILCVYHLLVSSIPFQCLPRFQKRTTSQSQSSGDFTSSCCFVPFTFSQASLWRSEVAPLETSRNFLRRPSLRHSFYGVVTTAISGLMVGI